MASPGHAEPRRRRPPGDLVPGVRAIEATRPSPRRPCAYGSRHHPPRGRPHPAHSRALLESTRTLDREQANPRAIQEQTGTNAKLNSWLAPEVIQGTHAGNHLYHSTAKKIDIRSKLVGFNRPVHPVHSFFFDRLQEAASDVFIAPEDSAIFLPLDVKALHQLI